MNFEKFTNLASSDEETIEEEEALSQPEAQKFSPETEREFLNVVLKFALEKGDKINEGAEAIIYSIDPAKLSPDQQKLLFGSEIDQEKLAAKIIKIYRGTYLGHKEAESQEKAYNVLASFKQSPVAKVPKTYGYHELECKPEDDLTNKLQSEGVRADEKISILFMDYVHGEDAMTHLYKKALDIYEKKYGIDDELTGLFNDYQENPTFENLQAIISRQLHFTRPKDSTANDDQIISAGQNWKIISEFLTKNDFTLDKKIVDKLRHSILTLESQQFFHNDLHERNIMFELDSEGNIIDVYLIDFSQADEHKREDKAGSDLQCIIRLDQLSKDKKQIKQQKLEQATSEAKNIMDQRDPKKKEEFQGQLKNIRELLKEGNYENLLAYLRYYVDQNEANVTALLMKLSKSKAYGGKVDEFVKTVRKNPKLYRPQFWIDLETVLKG